MKCLFAGAPAPEGGAHNMRVDNGIMYMDYYIDGFRANLPFTWGAQPHNGLIYFNDINSGLWIMKLGDKIEKGSTTAPGQ